tara:strand:+ start:27 stop:575 length:549 start_codon:yes stop_codon:yes gene_type:complete
MICPFLLLLNGENNVKKLLSCEANRQNQSRHLISAQTDASQTSTKNSINNINNNKKKNEEESGLSNSNARGKWSETERANFIRRRRGQRERTNRQHSLHAFQSSRESATERVVVLQERFIPEFEQKKTTETSENDAKQRGDGRRERRSVQLVRFEHADSILLLPRDTKSTREYVRDGSFTRF